MSKYEFSGLYAGGNIGEFKVYTTIEEYDGFQLQFDWGVNFSHLNDTTDDRYKELFYGFGEKKKHLMISMQQKANVVVHIN